MVLIPGDEHSSSYFRRTSDKESNFYNIDNRMRRPDYISTEQTRYQPTTMEKVESKIGYVVRKKMGVEQVPSCFQIGAMPKGLK